MTRAIAALIRHGDYRQIPGAPSALQPFPLTAEGRIQAKRGVEEVKEVLSDQGWTLCSQIDSSRQLRAWQTADLLAQGLAPELPGELQILSFDDLAERSVGAAANLTVAQIETVLAEDPRFPSPPADWKSNSHYCLPLQGAESLLDAGLRVARHIEQSMQSLAEQSEADCLKLFVGHGAAFRHAAHHLGILAFEDLARLSMFHCRPVLIERSAEGRWRHLGGDWKMRRRREPFID